MSRVLSVYSYTEGCIGNLHARVGLPPPPSVLLVGLESNGGLAAIPPFTFPCPLAPFTVLLCGPDPEQLPGTRAGSVGVQQRWLRGPGVPAEPPRRARCGGLYRRLLCSHPLHWGGAWAAAALPPVRRHGMVVGGAAALSPYFQHSEVTPMWLWACACSLDVAGL